MAYILENRPKMALLFFVLLASFVQFSFGDIYMVGGSAGWTTIGNIDYKQWAANKTFKVGDTIVFKYSPQFHNVMQVTHPEYKSCNATSPIATHTTGNDSITITTHGHHYFLCGVPGHCQAGQKVDINVLRVSMSPSSSPSSTPIPAVGTVPAPSPSHASYRLPSKLGIAMAVCLALLFSFA